MIKIIGVGGGGCNAVNLMHALGMKDVDFIVCNTDFQALAASPIPTKIQLGSSLTEGRGAGNKPEVGRDAANESIEDIKKVLLQNTKMVIITASLGGGTGTGATPVIANWAKKLGILTIALVTVPFRNEGRRRTKQAIKGLAEIEKNVDSLIIVENEKIREISGDLRIADAFSKVDNILANAAKGITEIITVPGYINVDFFDVETVLKKSGLAVMGIGVATGENRAIEAIEKAINSPLLNNNDIRDAKNILLNITSGTQEATMDEIGKVTDFVQAKAGVDADIIWGNGINKSLGDNFQVTIIATGVSNAMLIQSLDEIKITDELSTKPKLEEEYMSLFFLDNEYTTEEIAEIISLLSDLYREIGGDELVIKGTDIYESSKVLEPALI